MPPPVQTKRIIAELPNGQSFWLTIPITAKPEEIQSLAIQHLQSVGATISHSQPSQEAQPQVGSLPIQQSQPQVTPQQSAPVESNTSGYDPLKQSFIADPDLFKKVVMSLINPISHPLQPNRILPTVKEHVASTAPIIEGAAGVGATALASTVGAPAALAGLAGSVAMPVVNQIIRHYLGKDPGESIFGGNYQSPVGPIIEGTVANELGGKVLNKLGLGLEGLVASKRALTKSTGTSRELMNLGGTTGQLVGKDSIVGKGINLVEDILEPGAKSKSIDISSTRAAERIKDITSTSTPINASSTAVNTLLKEDNSSLLSRFLQNGKVTVGKERIVSGNARQDIQGYIMDKVFTDNRVLLDPTDLTKVSLNADKMLSDFGEVIAQQEKTGVTLFNRRQARDYTEFLKAIKSSTDISEIGGQFFKVNMLTRTIGLTGAALAGRISGIANPATIVGGYMGLTGIAKLLANRKAAPVFLNIIKGAPLGMSFQAAGRILTNSLTRQPITLQRQDGNEIPGLFDTDGQVRPLQ